MLAKDHSADGGAVAIKFMKYRDQFEKEVNARAEEGFDKFYVLDVIRTHDGDADEEFLRALERKGLEEYRN